MKPAKGSAVNSGGHSPGPGYVSSSTTTASDGSCGAIGSGVGTFMSGSIVHVLLYVEVHVEPAPRVVAVRLETADIGEVAASAQRAGRPERRHGCVVERQQRLLDGREVPARNVEAHRDRPLELHRAVLRQRTARW